MTVSNPKAVYLGTRFSLNDDLLKSKLLEILEQKNVPVFQMTKHPEEYRLIKM